MNMTLSEAIQRASVLSVDAELTPSEVESIKVILNALRRHKWPEEKPEKGQLCLTKDPNLKYYRVQCYVVAFSDIMVEIEGEVTNGTE